MEQQFMQACLEQAIQSRCADCSPRVRENSTPAQRLEVWKIWDIIIAMRQMQCIGTTYQPFNLPASCQEREQMLHFNPTEYCATTCDNMLKELELWQEKLGGGYPVIRNMISEFMKNKHEKSVITALADGKKHEDRSFGKIESTSNERKKKRKNLNIFENNHKTPVEIALRASHDEGIFEARLIEARRLLLYKRRKYLLTSCHLLSSLLSPLSSLFSLFSFLFSSLRSCHHVL